MESGLDRRTFITRGAAVVGGGLLSAGAVERLVARDALGRHHAHAEPYGPLRRTRDQRGVEVLALPAGFSYVTFGHTGTTMADGNPTPLALDGMSAFAGGRRHGHGHGRGNGHGRDRLVRLIRNSEDRNPAGVKGGLIGDRSKAYDPTGFGGTTTLVYDERRRRLVEDFVSLNGTIVNCAGGRGYRYRHWLTGEESVAGPDAADVTDRFAKRHGYLFETPVDRGPNELETGEPITAAGRFSHEAAAVDQRTGIVYETEDPGSGVGAGFYRYIPEHPEELTAGGALQMLAIKGQPQVDLRQGQRRGAVLRVDGSTSTTPIPTSSRSATRRARSTRAGARAARSSTAWRAAGRTTGRSTSSPRAAATRRTATSTPTTSRRASARSGRTGPAAAATTAGRSCSSTSRRRAQKLDGPDNLTVTPRGGLIACEDDPSTAFGDEPPEDTHPLAPGIENVNRLIGITRRGEAFEFAVNVHSGSELAGCCFSPSGDTLFFNIFGRARFDEDPVEGMTCAVTGPWHRGPL